MQKISMRRASAAVIIRDEPTARLAETMDCNRHMLSVIAAILVPLSLLTGLLGIVVIGIAAYLLMRGLRWI